MFELLNATRHLNPIVKLPGNMISNQIVSDFYDCDFLLPGMPEQEFENVLSKIKLAILGHENYLNFSSAYASYFVSNNVPILTQINNRFEDEFGTQLVFPLPNEIGTQLAGVIRELDSCPRPKERALYSIYAEEQWREFVTQCMSEIRNDS